MRDRTQLPLDLSFDPRFGEDDFVVAPSNAMAHTLLSRWPDWPGRTLLLVGPEGCGKTHLAAMWARRAAARTIVGTDLTFIDPRLVAAGNALIEDGDRLGSGEFPLFHALNLVRDGNTALLITARAPPDQWGLVTPDLLSRLRLAPLLRIEPPDDALLRAVLVKLFLDRQVTVEAGVIEYILVRMNRSLGEARRLVTELDRASLVRQGKISRAVAAEVLALTEP